MVDKNGASFLYRKRGVYYFSKQVPCDIKAPVNLYLMYSITSPENSCVILVTF